MCAGARSRAARAVFRVRRRPTLPASAAAALRGRRYGAQRFWAGRRPFCGARCLSWSGAPALAVWFAPGSSAFGGSSKTR
eukprot:9879697-Lingulodinium_polyedra.AAC.1